MLKTVWTYGLILLSCCIVVRTAVFYPEDMGQEKCESDGIYWWIKKGDMIPCSPTCDEVYNLTDKNQISSKSINQLCKLNMAEGRFYHDIAPKDRCTCNNGAAYYKLERQDVLRFKTEVKWICLERAKWQFTHVSTSLYKVTCFK